MPSLVLKILLGAVVLFVAAWYLAPRQRFDTDVTFDASALGDDLDAYLRAAESRYPDIVPGVAKHIVWAGAPGARTPLSIVYLHGFSATAQEIRPLPDNVARALGANLFFTRLTGHGRGGAAMAEARVEDWIADLAEAMAIGRRIGDEVIVIATSTGGTLAAVAATDPALSDRLKAVVMVSPNFGINNKAAALLTAPFARAWVPLVAGSERSFEPENEDHARYWTTRYPIGAVFPMAELVRHAARLDYASVHAPALFVLSDADSVVRPDISRRIAARWGAGATVHAVVTGPGDDPSAHVIAGDILSPGQTAPLTEVIVGWLGGL